MNVELAFVLSNVHDLSGKKLHPVHTVNMLSRVLCMCSTATLTQLLSHTQNYFSFHG